MQKLLTRLAAAASFAITLMVPVAASASVGARKPDLASYGLPAVIPAECIAPERIDEDGMPMQIIGPGQPQEPILKEMEVGSTNCFDGVAFVVKTDGRVIPGYKAGYVRTPSLASYWRLKVSIFSVKGGMKAKTYRPKLPAIGEVWHPRTTQDSSDFYLKLKDGARLPYRVRAEQAGKIWRIIIEVARLA